MHNCLCRDMNWNLGKYDQDVVHVKQRQLHSYLEPGKFVCYKNPIHIHVFYKLLCIFKSFCVLDTTLYILYAKLFTKYSAHWICLKWYFSCEPMGRKRMGAYAIFRKFFRSRIEAGQPLLELSLTEHFKQNFIQPANPPQHQLIWEAWCLSFVLLVHYNTPHKKFFGHIPLQGRMPHTCQ